MHEALYEIPLRNAQGEVVGHAIVDADLIDWLNGWRWCLRVSGYAVRGRRRNGNHETVFMHREVLGIQPGERRFTDHINGDKLDNRRANLREVTYAQNNQNLRSKGKTSSFRGVYYEKRLGKFIARCRVNGQQHHLGCFVDELEAARVASEFRAIHLPFSEDARRAS